MRKLLACTVFFAGLMWGPVFALEPPTGVYIKAKEQCDTVKKDLQAYLETGETVLTAKGIQGIEYHCEFLDWNASKLSPGAVVIAMCEEPDLAVPEVFAIMTRGEGELDVNTMSAGDGDEEDANAGLYHLCEGVSPP